MRFPPSVAALLARLHYCENTRGGRKGRTSPKRNVPGVGLFPSLSRYQVVVNRRKYGQPDQCRNGRSGGIQHLAEILASAVGTMIEWYDFYIFGSLTAVLALKFYPPGNDTFAYIAYLATFAVGFLVRPFGALFFGRIGDIVGRKYAFLVTLTIMGGATALIGLLPTYKTAGWFAPIILIMIRILQGLALGGEYGGAAVYVAEHVPDRKRGFYTSFIQITATLGLFVSLIVILPTQQSMTTELSRLGAGGFRSSFPSSWSPSRSTSA